MLGQTTSIGENPQRESKGNPVRPGEEGDDEVHTPPRHMRDKHGADFACHEWSGVHFRDAACRGSHYTVDVETSCIGGLGRAMTKNL